MPLAHDAKKELDKLRRETEERRKDEGDESGGETDIDELDEIILQNEKPHSVSEADRLN